MKITTCEPELFRLLQCEPLWPTQKQKRLTPVNIYIEVQKQVIGWFCLKTKPNFKREKLQNGVVLLPILQSEVSLTKIFNTTL